MFLIRGVNDCTILDIHFISDFDIMHITSNYSVKPNAAGVPQYNVANNGGVFGNKTILWDLRTFTINSFYNHSKKIVPIKSGQLLLINCRTVAVVFFRFAEQVNSQRDLVETARIKLNIPHYMRIGIRNHVSAEIYTNNWRDIL